MGASQSANKTNAPKSSNASSVNKRNNTKNNTKKNNNQAPVVWNGKVLPPATPAGQKSNINSNWKPAANKKSRRKTRRNRK
jgi:hypothetical protein